MHICKQVSLLHILSCLCPLHLLTKHAALFVLEAKSVNHDQAQIMQFC